MKTVPVVIVGGGPAGISAAVQLRRSGIEPILFETETPGGLLRQADWIENYPGFPSGIRGEALARLLGDGLVRWSVDIRREEVTALDYDPSLRTFAVVTNTGNHTAERIIVASGTKPKRLPLADGSPGECRRLIFYDWTKIPPDGQGRVAVIGAGDIALDYALGLSRNPGYEVTVLCRDERCRALRLLQERAAANPAIRMMYRSEADDIKPAPAGKLRLSGKTGLKPFSLEADFLLIAIGREPRRDFFSPRLLDLEADLILNDRLFLAGDVKNGFRRQVGIAVGDGLAAAMAVAQDRPEGESE